MCKSERRASIERLRRELGVLPPGDLRMARAALCGDDEWGRTWERVVQHRFRSEGKLHGHVVGNLLIVALWELMEDPVRALEWVGRLLGAHGRVLLMATVPLDIHAEVELNGEISTVRGQVACALTSGRVREISLIPPNLSPEAISRRRSYASRPKPKPTRVWRGGCLRSPMRFRA